MSEAHQLQELGIGLNELINLVHGAQPEGDALDQLTTAVLIAERLGDLGDHLIGHFVDQARHAGASWTAIGVSMGVTKQAAQKRFVPGAGDLPKDGLLSRFTPRAKAVVDLARDQARRMQNAEVGTEHFVLALMANDGLASQAVEAQGVTVKKVRSRVDALGLPKAESLPERIPFSTQSRKVLELSLREALRRGHNYIGTEHILLGLLADPDSRGSRVLLDLGVTVEQTSAWVDETLARLAATKGV
jgi:Clp amino terminal domain, pathogenicity island component